MIEFNIPAKQENPVASSLSSTLYSFFDKVQLGGESAVKNDLGYKVIIGKLKSPKEWSPTFHQCLKDGWHENFDPDCPGDVTSFVKHSDVVGEESLYLYFSWKVAAWEKLLAWTSALVYGHPTDKLEAYAKGMFKVIVCGYTTKKSKNGLTIDWIPPGDAYADEPTTNEDEEEGIEGDDA